jgi:hypothetical protein
VHTPHISVPPHLSWIVPQFLFSAAHVVGVQPQTFAVAPPPHVSGGTQVPHSNVPPHLSLTVPQFFS